MRLKVFAIISVIIGFAVRVYLTFVLPKWIDEVSTTKYINLPFRNLLFEHFDLHPPGYYLFLKLWLVVSPSLVWLRFSSVLFFLFNCYLLYRIGIAFLNKRYAYFLIIAYAFSGYNIIFDWSLRPYTGLCTLILASFYLLTLRQSRKVLLAFLLLNTLGLYFDYGFVWYFFPINLFIIYHAFRYAKEKNTLNLKNFLLPSLGSLVLYTMIWLPQFRRYYREALIGVDWIRYYIYPTFFVPFFLGAAHGNSLLVIVMGIFLLVGSICLFLKKQKALVYFFPASSLGVLYFTFIFSAFISPVLHVRNLQIVGLAVIVLYALCFYMVSIKKYFYSIFMILGIYIINFFLIVNTIFTAPGRLLLKF